MLYLCWQERNRIIDEMNTPYLVEAKRENNKLRLTLQQL